MNSRSVLSLSIFLLFVISLAQPVSAGPVDTSIEVVAKGMEKYMEHKAKKPLENNFGVTFGNASEMEDLTPAQRLVYMVAAAQHHPFELEWVRNQIASDVVYYYIGMFFLMITTFGLGMLHKVAPEFVNSLTHKFEGHDSPFDYTVYFTTVIKLAILPPLAFPIIEGLLEFEQGLSSGLTLNALEFLDMSTAVGGAISFFEGWAYSFCGWFFALRLQFMNLFIAHILKVILIFAAVWWSSHYIAQILGEWFLTALFMRPVVLWYSSLAVQHIASANTNYGITPDMSPTEAYSHVWSTTFDVAGIISTDMTAVIVVSAITAAVAVTWPIIKVILKIIMGYLKGALFHVISMFMTSYKARGN